MLKIYIIKKPITRLRLKEIAEERFGDLVKVVVDIRKEVMAVGGELHADEEVLLSENYDSKREDTWGINIYVDKPRDEMIEFDSVINIKPSYQNRTRNVENPEIKKKIIEIVDKLIL
ncbi:MAG: DUF5674 family protein [Candidatus Pacebacteria bacterium]|nr:DUF5674 family protein [Candidatus Paceibacterota bacterium]